MIIKPYIKYPKLSELKVGNKIRFTKRNYESSKWNHLCGKLVTVNYIGIYVIGVEEISAMKFAFDFFEIEDDLPF